MAWLCPSVFLSVHMQNRVCPNFSCMHITYFTSLDLYFDNKGRSPPFWIYSSYVAPWYIPLFEPLSLTPGGHMRLFTLYTIFKATSPMRHFVSLVSSSNIFCIMLYLFIAVLFAGNKTTTTAWLQFEFCLFYFRKFHLVICPCDGNAKVEYQLIFFFTLANVVLMLRSGLHSVIILDNHHIAMISRRIIYLILREIWILPYSL